MIKFEWENFSHSKKIKKIEKIFLFDFLNIFNGFNMNKCDPINDYYKYVVIWHKSIKSQYLIFGVLTEGKNEKIKKST